MRRGRKKNKKNKEMVNCNNKTILMVRMTMMKKIAWTRSKSFSLNILANLSLLRV